MVSVEKWFPKRVSSAQMELISLREPGVCVSNMGIHLDDRIYEEPNTFNPYRFLNTAATGEFTSKAMLSTASPSSLAFSYGHYAWYVYDSQSRNNKRMSNLISSPGRVYVSQMLKTVAAYLVAHYDFGTKPYREKKKKIGSRV